MRMFRAVATGFAWAAIVCFVGAFLGGLQEEAGLLICSCFLAGFSAVALLVTKGGE
ncbi:hypothetical protein ACTQZK_01750 [Paraeggerthella sp. LCP19S3_G8]|uniref:hypothetical protein n=1 Tax=Paraeggerthella sp. LCP19S3_G8 TaxID=3440248 RepID=UPI003F9CEB2C